MKNNSKLSSGKAKKLSKREELAVILEYGKDNNARIELIMALFRVRRRKKPNL